MPFSQLPALLPGCLAPITAVLDRRSASRLLRLPCGALITRGSRTVTSWLRAAGITTEDAIPGPARRLAQGRLLVSLHCLPLYKQNNASQLLQ